MSPRIGAFVVLGFAALWLWVGAHALPAPWALIVGIAGAAGLLVVAWVVLRQRALLGSGRGFDRRIFWLAVLFEVVAANIGAWLLGRAGAMGYLWPMIGSVVALHFIGLYLASRDRRFLALTAGMLAVNLAALTFVPGSAAMLAVAGLGSSAALAAALVARR